MQFTETDLQHMSYRELVELAKMNGVYQKKSAKKVALIRRLSSVCASPPEISERENVDPNKSKLPTLKEVDETCVSESDDDANNRRRTFTKATPSQKMDESSVFESDDDATNRRRTFTKAKMPERKGSPLSEKPHGTLTRQNTFTKDDSPDTDQAVTPRKSKRSDARNSPANNAPLTRQNTFTRSEDPKSPQPVVEVAEDKSPVRSSKRLTSMEHVKDTTDSPILTRQNTFTRSPNPINPNSPIKENVNTTAQAAGASDENYSQTPRSGRKMSSSEGTKEPTLKREGTFVKSPEKKHYDCPNYESPAAKTPAIESLTVFQRLSTRMSASARRSLVASEKRSSLRNKQFLTPQAEKKSHLVAMREGRMRNLSPKSLTKSMKVATPVVPVVKQPASTKKSSAKKMPNFAAIHKKNFEKMESLFDHKRRLKDRSDFLMSPPAQNARVSRIPMLAKAASAPGNNKTKSSLLQMKMATKERLKKAVAQKCATGLAQNSINDGKVLKGVRTNKRFELLRQAQKAKPTTQSKW